MSAERSSPVDRLFGAIVPRAVDSIDPDALVAQIDVDALIERIDVDGLVRRVDLDSLLDSIDIDGLLDRIDMAKLLDRVDVDGLIRRVDLDALLASVDLDALIGQLDVDALIARLDVNALVARLDVNALVMRLDMDQLLENVDVRALVKQAGIDQIIAETTTGMAARTLDLLRRQVLGVDTILLGFVDRVLRRGSSRSQPGALRTTGRPAGPISRLLAFGADALAVSLLFSAIVSLGAWLVDLFVADHQRLSTGGPIWAVAYLGWWFVYLTGSLIIAGRTPGKTLVGLRVRAADGRPLGPWRAAVRTVTLPISFIGALGLIVGVVRRDRRALHDLFAGSQEVVDWGDREAALPSALANWIAQQQPELVAPGQENVSPPLTFDGTQVGGATPT